MAGKYQRYSEYKESEIDWAFTIPKHWESKRLKYIFSIRKRIAGTLGFDVLSITQKGIKIKDIESGAGQVSMDYTKYQLVEKGDFAMNHMDLLTGFVDISKHDGVTSPDYRVFVIQDPELYEKRYYLYLLQLGYQQKLFFHLGQGSAHLGRWRLPTEAFNEIQYPKPLFNEQQAIANFLDHETAKIDALIVKQEKLIELLKEKRQAVISHAVTKGLNPDVTMKDSGIEWLGEVPEHWEVVRIKHTAKSIIAGPFGSSITKDMYVPSGFKVYGQEHAIANSFDVGDYYINEQNFNILKRYSISSGDLILSCVGTFGKVSVVPTMFEAGIINPRLILIRPSSVVSSDYLAKFMQSDVSYKQFEVLSRGGTMGVINIGILSDIFIALPSLDEQNKIKEFIESQASKYEKLIKKATSSISLLKERKSSLISAAVTGKIDVRHHVSHPAGNAEIIEEVQG